MVLPIYDANPVRRTPVVTYLLILVNVAIFLTEPVATAPLFGGQNVAAVCKQEAYFRDYAAIPKEITSNEQLPPQRTGVQTDRGVVPCPEDTSHDKVPALSVLFAMFLHGGWAHLLGNMLFLFVFGN